MPTFFFHVAIDIAETLERPLLSTSDPSDIFQTSIYKALSGLSKDGVFPPGKCQQSYSDEIVAASLDGSYRKPDIVDSDSKHSEGVQEFQRQNPSILPGRRIFNDWRCGKISLLKIDMLHHATTGDQEPNHKVDGHITNGLGAGPGGLATKGRYEPTDSEEHDLGWGVVRLYRDTEETPGLYDDVVGTKNSKHGRGASRLGSSRESSVFMDEDCTTLCILAVPSYLTPSDFLGFVGEKTREEVSHFRMIRTERVNRYMVLMRFRSGKKAREWRKEWNGKVFNSTEVRSSSTPKVCTVN